MSLSVDKSFLNSQSSKDSATDTSSSSTWRGRTLLEIPLPSHGAEPDKAYACVSIVVGVALIFILSGAAIYFVGAISNIYALELTGEILMGIGVVLDLLLTCCCSSLAIGKKIFKEYQDCAKISKL